MGVFFDMGKGFWELRRSRKLESQELGPQDRWWVFEAEDARLGLAGFQAPEGPC